MNHVRREGRPTVEMRRGGNPLSMTGTEEMGHVELLATAVAMNLEGAPSEAVDEVVTNPAVAARVGALEPRHHLTGGLSALPWDADGVPFNANCVDAAGNLIANVAAEAVGRTLAARPRAARSPGASRAWPATPSAR